MYTRTIYRYEHVYKNSDRQFQTVCIMPFLMSTIVHRFINSFIDDDNRIVLDTIPGQQDCQNDYINASYLDVSILCNALNNCCLYYKSCILAACIFFI